MKKKIFCFINSNSLGWVIPVALAEDGHCLASHCSSSEGWAYSDIGMNSDRKHDVYAKHYPEGYELVWVEGDELKNNKEFRAACDNNAKLAREAKADTQETK